MAARSRGTFELLFTWINGRTEYESPAEELSERRREALHNSVARGKYGFVLVAHRNWRLEKQTREIRLSSPALDDLWDLPAGEAVNRILGYDDGPTWRAGIAGLEPQEARAVRFLVCMCWGMGDVMKHTKMSPAAIRKAKSEGRRKLREFFRLPRNQPSANGGNVCAGGRTVAGEASA